MHLHVQVHTHVHGRTNVYVLLCISMCICSLARSRSTLTSVALPVSRKMRSSSALADTCDGWKITGANAKFMKSSRHHAVWHIDWACETEAGTFACLLRGAWFEVLEITSGKKPDYCTTCETICMRER